MIKIYLYIYIIKYIQFENVLGSLGVNTRFGDLLGWLGDIFGLNTRCAYGLVRIGEILGLIPKKIKI